MRIHSPEGSALLPRGRRLSAETTCSRFPARRMHRYSGVAFGGSVPRQPWAIRNRVIGIRLGGTILDIHRVANEFRLLPVNPVRPVEMPRQNGRSVVRHER